MVKYSSPEVIFADRVNMVATEVAENFNISRCDAAAIIISSLQELDKVTPAEVEELKQALLNCCYVT